MNNDLCICERSVARTRSETLTNRCNICGNIIIQLPPALTGNIECEPVYQNIESDNSLSSEDEFDDIEECECNENQAGERCDYCLNQTTQNKVIDIEQTKTLIDAYSDILLTEQRNTGTIPKALADLNSQETNKRFRISY